MFLSFIADYSNAASAYKWAGSSPNSAYSGLAAAKVESAVIPWRSPKVEPTSPWKTTQDPYQLFGATSSRLASSGEFQWLTHRHTRERIKYIAHSV